MKEITNFLKSLREITQKDKRYKLEAYTFVMSALNFTVRRLNKPRHITGQELLEDIRNYALEEFGPMARSVLEHWGITKTEDFGEIVFNLVDAKLLGKTEEDSKEDFKNVYDFKKAFDINYKYDLEEA